MLRFMESLLDGQKSSQTSETRSSQENRNAVSRQAPIGISVSIIIFVLGWWLLPAGKDTDFPSYGDKLRYTLRWQSLSMMPLIYCFKTVADSRYSSTAINPIQGKSEHLLTLQSKIMQNTLEQLVLSLPGQWILATYLTASAMPRVIPSLVIIFVLGRILFIIGYNKHPMKRSYGMSMTAAPTLATHVYCLFCFFFYHLLGF